MPAQKNIYLNFSEVDELQTAIMKYIDLWVHQEKVPVPFKKIVENMEENGIKRPTVIKAIYVLVRKGYIRRSYEISSRSKISFVQLRRV